MYSDRFATGSKYLDKICFKNGKWFTQVRIKNFRHMKLYPSVVLHYSSVLGSGKLM